jgi:hypothetical protein
VALSCAAFFSRTHTEAAIQAAVSANRVDDVPRIKLYATTPNVVAGRETELDPTEPTLDLYIPQPDKATGAAVLILPGGGYQMLTVPGEGAELCRFFPVAQRRSFRTALSTRATLSLSDDAVGRSTRAEAHSSASSGVSYRSRQGRGSGRIGWWATWRQCWATLYDNKLLPEAPYVADATDGLSAKPLLRCCSIR